MWRKNEKIKEKQRSDEKKERLKNAAMTKIITVFPNCKQLVSQGVRKIYR